MSRADLLRCPERLNPAAADLWAAVAAPALRDGRLTEATKEAFTVYCEVRVVADALGEMVNALPVEFPDPAGELVAHPMYAASLSLAEAALDIERALGVGMFGEAAMKERGGTLGSLRDALFNQSDPRVTWHLLGPRVIDGGEGDG